VDDISFLHQGLEEPVKPIVVIVEDDHLLGISLKKYLQESLPLEIKLYHNSEECLMEFAKSHSPTHPFCLVADISLGQGSDGLLLIDILKDKGFKFVPIVMTGFASIETAISATKKGVYHYLTKPFEVKELEQLIVNAIKDKLNIHVNPKGVSEPELLIKMPKRFILPKTKMEDVQPQDIFYGMVGKSKVMKELFARIEKVAKTDSTILISGDSGTGKELVTKAIHELSSRSLAPRVSVNCGAIPLELLESELFGHIKGSFTGAISNRKGRFEMADKGTIFLDEIGDMPLLLQVKLLRVLQLKEIEPVGSSESFKVDVRVIAATHRDLEKIVAEEKFREDLYYRLNVIPIRVPALKERREDIPLLISYFLKKFVSADRSNEVSFTQESMDLLISYDWPGNVRELENVVERLVILRGGNEILAEELPAKIYRTNPLVSSQYKTLFELPDTGVDLKQILSDIEDSLILQALNKTSGNKNQASKLLQLNRTTLIEKLKKKGLESSSSSLE
jgi:two-component system response regulator PilR (NtrC family)